VKQPLGVAFDKSLVTRLRRAAYWIPGLTISGICEKGAVEELERVEKEYAREHAGALPPELPPDARMPRAPRKVASE
jgi:hypothetical protein